jgi:hypothetical protein
MSLAKEISGFLLVGSSRGRDLYVIYLSFFSTYHRQYGNFIIITDINRKYIRYIH